MTINYMYLVSETLPGVNLIDSILGVFDNIKEAEKACFKTNHLVMRFNLNEDLGADRMPPTNATEEEAWYPMAKQSA
jgi:hypothetical protein